jgi:hypothetical protein
MPLHQGEFFSAFSRSVPVNQNPKAEQGNDGNENEDHTAPENRPGG